MGPLKRVPESKAAKIEMPQLALALDTLRLNHLMKSAREREKKTELSKQGATTRHNNNQEGYWKCREINFGRRERWKKGGREGRSK